MFNCLYLQHDLEMTAEKLDKLARVMEEGKNRWYRLPKVTSLVESMLKSNLEVFDIKEDESQRESEIKKIAFLLHSNLAATEEQNGLCALFQELIFSPEGIMLKFLPGMPHDVMFEIIGEMKKEIDKTYKVAP